MIGIIDSHVHLYPPWVNADPGGWAASRGEAGWAALCTRRRRDGRPVQGFPDLAGLLGAMDAAGVGRAVIMGWYWERPETCAEHNRFCAGCVRAHPDRLSGFATLHPSAGLGPVREEILRARGEGLCGIGELSPHSQGFAVDDAAFQAGVALAAELRLPVALHVTDPESRPYPGRVDTPLADFVRLAGAHPGAAFILSHWGGLLPLRHPEAAALGNLHYDTAASPLLYDDGIWRRFLSAVGPERVLFGSDYPLNNYPALDREPGMGRFLDEARRCLCGPGELAAVLEGNAQKLFGNAARA